jgi:alcohol dehydrogenase (cytochrome c)
MTAWAWYSQTVDWRQSSTFFRSYSTANNPGMKAMKQWLLALGLLSAIASAADAPPFTAEQLKTLPTQNWITNGGSVYNQRYSPLKQINTGNVGTLKANWRTQLNGSGVGPPYSGEAQPIVYDGVIYIPTGADDVFAIDVESGKLLWTYQANLDKAINTICCGWTSRGVGLGDGKIFLGRLDGKLAALDQRTGKEVWSVQAERWQEGYTITSAPLYYDGMVIAGFAGAEYGTRGRVRAYNAKDGALLWTFYTVPAPGEFGHNTWPADNDAWKYGGGTVWHTPAVDPELGLIYFSTGNAGPDYNGSLRKGDNLFTSSIVALDIKSGKYRWHFQEVHHDIWDYDAPNPVVLFDIDYQNKKRKALAQVGKTGWVYILDRVTGKPLIGIDEKPVPQEPRQATAKTQPYPRGDAAIPQEIPVAPYGFRLVNQGRIFTPFWDEPTLIAPGPVAGPNWAPSSYNVDHGYLYVCSGERVGNFRAGEIEANPPPGRSYTGGGRGGRTVALPVTGIFAAMDMRTNKIVWRQRWIDRCYSGSVTSAGNLVFTGRNDGRFVALDAGNGDVLWEFQTGAGVNATASIFEHKGKQHIVIYSAGSLLGGSPGGDSVWSFSLDGTMGPASAPAAVVAPMPAATTSAQAANATAGRALFTQYCSQCHGQDGKNGHAGAPDITTITDRQIATNAVFNGKNAMPPFGRILTPQEARDVAEFVVTALGK